MHLFHSAYIQHGGNVKTLHFSLAKVVDCVNLVCSMFPCAEIAYLATLSFVRVCLHRARVCMCMF